VRAAERADGHTNRWWLDPLHGRGYPTDMVDVYGVEPPVHAGDLATIAAPLDFLGVNYYFRFRVAADPSVATLGYRQVPVDGSATTAMGWEIHPQGLRDVLVRLTKEYECRALYVTENGAAFDDTPDADGYVHDDDRAAYLRDHLDAMAGAVADGAPVKGFYAWSLTDNFEWAYGYRPRFGLAYVDYGTQRRTLKYSGQVYAGIIAGG
jgi:beta-glucosidase